MKILFAAVSVLALTSMLAACTPVGVGVAAGSTAGVAAAREGGLKGSLEDAKISAKISDLWFRHDFTMFSKLNLTVDQGRVLITGVVQKPEHRVEAVRLAWQAEGVKQVINEVKVANSEGITGWGRDKWITARLRADILFDKNIQGVNYSIDTVQSIVYLMGVAQNQAELDRVTFHARQVPYVKQVVSYVKMAGVPNNQILQPQTQSGAMPQAQSGQQFQGQTQYGMTGANATVPPVSSQPIGQSGMQEQNLPPYNSGNNSYGTTYGTTYSTAPTASQPGRPSPIVGTGNDF
ncbi:MAG TPA: BON domain-containing protein [Alphaproteobacteria bacterium]